MMGKTTVFDVETNETGQTISTVSDIFHMNSLEQFLRSGPDRNDQDHAAPQRYPRMSGATAQ